MVHNNVVCGCTLHERDPFANVGVTDVAAFAASHAMDAEAERVEARANKCTGGLAVGTIREKFPQRI